MEQAVVSVFLISQPIGQKALTHELVMLVGATNPDKIELEKALRLWTELSWFLDEVEVGTAEKSPDGTRQLPRGLAVGQPAQPAPDARRRMREPCAARSGGIAVHRPYREAEVFDIRRVSGGSKSA